MRDIPDAPWVGNCKEDYYGCDEEETILCECCGECILKDEAVNIDGIMLCEDCYRENVEEDAE